MVVSFLGELDSECRWGLTRSKKAAGGGPGFPEGSIQQGDGARAQALRPSCFCFVEKLWLPELAGRERGPRKHLEGVEMGRGGLLVSGEVPKGARLSLRLGHPSKGGWERRTRNLPGTCCPRLGCLALWLRAWLLAVVLARELLFCGRCAQNPLDVFVATLWLSSWGDSQPLTL